MGDGVLLFKILFGHFSIGGVEGLGNIFGVKLFDFSSDLGEADIGLTLLIWVGLLNPKDDANPLVAGSWFVLYWLAWKKSKIFSSYYPTITEQWVLKQQWWMSIKVWGILCNSEAPYGYGCV